MRRLLVTTGAVLTVLATGLSLAACQSDADTVSDNLSREAEQFRVSRDIVFYNSITDKYMFEVKGRCSVDDSTDLSNTLAVTCRNGPDEYVKEYLGKADNVAWFAVQTEPSDVSRYHYEIILKPESIIPDIKVESGQQ